MITNTDLNDLQFEDVEDYSADYASEYSSDYTPPVTSEENIAAINQPSTQKRRRGSMFIQLICGNKWTSGLLLVMLVLLLAIVVIAMGGSKDTQTQSLEDFANTLTHQDPIEIDPTTLDDSITGPLMQQLLNAYDRKELDSSDLNEDAGETAQRRAFYWMATDKNLNKYDHTQVMQRYALATLYYATNNVPTRFEENPIPWKTAHLWLSNAHVCEWKGIVCNEKLHVTAIDLADNNLTGSIPIELILIAGHLTTLDFTSNLIHMEDSRFDVFKGLDQLEDLLLDDNYMVYDKGLPPQFRHLVNLKKLRLSYNLFAGELEVDHKVLANMGKLTHLEIESNFLNGNLPPVIGEMTNLVYLYLRRNELSFNLDFLKTGKLKDLFALWLDSNTITGTIPTEIGLLTELASVSMTNSTISGSLPSQMGNLLGLRRLWLYNNQLTGTIPASFDKLTELQVFEIQGNSIGGAMPQGVCYNIGQSDYEQKSLTADCKSAVECEKDCCSECY